MGAPCALDRFSINFFRPSPFLWTAHHDHRPDRQASVSAAARCFLNGADFVHDCFQGCSHELMHFLGLVSLDEIWFPVTAGEESDELFIVHARQHGWIRDLVAVQMKNGYDRAVT